MKAEISVSDLGGFMFFTTGWPRSEGFVGYTSYNSLSVYVLMPSTSGGTMSEPFRYIVRYVTTLNSTGEFQAANIVQHQYFTKLYLVRHFFV